jgi:hypothetical protein
VKGFQLAIGECKILALVELEENVIGFKWMLFDVVVELIFWLRSQHLKKFHPCIPDSVSHLPRD